MKNGSESYDAIAYGDLLAELTSTKVIARTNAAVDRLNHYLSQCLNPNPVDSRLLDIKVNGNWMPMAVNDPVIFTQSMKFDGETNIFNGEEGVIVGFTATTIMVRVNAATFDVKMKER